MKEIYKVIEFVVVFMWIVIISAGSVVALGVTSPWVFFVVGIVANIVFNKLYKTQ